LIIGLVDAYQIISALTDGFAAVCIAREDMHSAGSLDFAFKAITAMVGIIVVMAGGDLVMVTIAFPIVAVVLLFVIFRVVIKNYEHIKLSFYGGGIFLSAAAVGVYNVAYRVVFILMFVPGFTVLALFPIGFSF
jgi:hypothetical protein